MRIPQATDFACKKRSFRILEVSEHIMRPENLAVLSPFVRTGPDSGDPLERKSRAVQRASNTIYLFQSHSGNVTVWPLGRYAVS